jgi:hypothetical protein
MHPATNEGVESFPGECKRAATAFVFVLDLFRSSRLEHFVLSLLVNPHDPCS